MTTCCAWRPRRANDSAHSSGRCSLSSEGPWGGSGGARLASVRARIAAACSRVGRDPGEVTLVAVTKGQDPAVIHDELTGSGQLVLGESRLQEWRAKREHLGTEVEWHLVGHLQRNKVRYCREFSLIHSLDSLRLAEALEAEGARKGHVFETLLQVNVAREETKHGVPPEGAAEFLAAVREMPHVEVLGLMTMAPHHEDPERSRGPFRELRRLRDNLGLEALSMGMSADFEVAVEEGATLVRVGTSLFPPAPIPRLGGTFPT